MPDHVLRGLLESHLPNLYHLELWMGTENYGCDVDATDMYKLLYKNETGLFPSLEYLGIRNYADINTYCEAIVASAIVSRIRILDLSLGSLGDEGGRALLKLKDRSDLMLEVLDIHYHSISEDVVKDLHKLPMIVVLTDFEAGERYVALGE
jgi:hypothetical protein